MSRPWGSKLYRISSALLLFEVVSGLVSWSAAGDGYFVQAFILFHLVVGVVAGAPAVLFYVKHWREARRWHPSRRVSTEGHVGGLLLVLATGTGIALPWAVRSAYGSGVYWVHVLSALAATAFIAWHVGASWYKHRARERAKGSRAVQQGLRNVLAITAGAVVATVLLGAAWQTRERPYFTPASYAMPYGESPFAPSFTQTPDNRFIREEALAGSGGCGRSGCHEQVRHQWAASAHRYAADNPFFRHALDLMEAEEGKNATRYCGGCHDPIALLSGQMDVNAPARESAGEGISCVVCHAIELTGPPEGTGGYRVVPPERYLFWNADGGVGAWLHEALIRMKPEGHARIFSRPEYSEGEYCAVCHKQSIDVVTNHDRWLRLQDQYDSWLQSGFSGASAFARETPEMKTCNDCHMRLASAANEPGARNGKVMSHRYIAANTALPVFYGHPKQLEETIRWLQRDELLVEIHERFREAHPGEKRAARVEFDVVVTNRIGHRFPTGPLDLYEAWLAVEVEDAEGKIVYTSGDLQKNGHLDPQAHQFIAPPIDRQGNWLRRHDLWSAHVKAYNLSIPALEPELVRFAVTLPAEAAPPFRVSARVRYRRFNRWYTEWVLGKDAPRYPIVDMARAASAIDMSEPTVPRGEGRLRYARALFRKQEFDRAATLMREHLRHAPTDTTALLDLAEVEMARGSLDSFEAAVSLLAAAYEVNPANSRTRALLATARRKQGRFDEALHLFEKLKQEFPKDVRILNEVGYTYWLMDDPEKALPAYARSLQVDPEQAVTHFRRSLALAALNRSREADEAMRLYEKYRNRPEAIRNAAPFFTEHDWAKREHQLQHVHRSEPIP